MKCKELKDKQKDFIKKLKKSKSDGDKWIYKNFKKALKKENYCTRGL